MNVLVFAPHADDEILGCGGTIARHTAEGDQVYVCVVTRGKPPVYKVSDELLTSQPHNRMEEVEASNKCLGIVKTFFLQHPAVMLETVPRYELNKSIMEVINEIIGYLRDFNIVTVAIRLLLALLLGGTIGLERGKQGRAAGMRTHILVCLGAAMTAMTGLFIQNEFGLSVFLFILKKG